MFPSLVFVAPFLSLAGGLLVLGFTLGCFMVIFLLSWGLIHLLYLIWNLLFTERYLSPLRIIICQHGVLVRRLSKRWVCICCHYCTLNKCLRVVNCISFKQQMLLVIKAVFLIFFKCNLSFRVFIFSLKNRFHSVEWGHVMW